MGKTCDTISGHCSEPACVGIGCGPMTHCTMGKCIDDCMGAVCPSGQSCKMGACADDPNATTTSGSGGAGGTTGTFADTGVGAGGAPPSSGSGNGVDEGFGSKKKGCACRVGEGGSGDDLQGLAGLALGAVAVFARRRRR